MSNLNVASFEFYVLGVHCLSMNVDSFLNVLFFLGVRTFISCLQCSSLSALDQSYNSLIDAYLRVKTTNRESLCLVLLMSNCLLLYRMLCE